MADSRPLRRQQLLSCAIAAVLGGFVYLNALHNPFVYDDHRTIVDNSSIQSLRDPRAIVLHEATRPLVNLSYAIDRAIWGVEPFGFHLTNVLLHMVNVVLLFLIAIGIVSDRESTTNQERGTDQEPGARNQELRAVPAASAAAVLFAIHPMMTEAVGYISDRPDVLSATFFLLAVLCARRWMRGSGAKWWVLSVGFWIAALLAKETAVVLPAVLFCYDRLVLQDTRQRRRNLWRLHVPLAGLALLAGAVRLSVFVFIERPGGVTVHPLSLLGQAVVIWRYVRLLLVPAGQTIFHDVQPIGALLEPRALIAAMALVVVPFMCAMAWRTRRAAGATTFGVIWFLLLLVPSSLLVGIDPAEGMAEHRVYLASCGLFLIVGLGFGWLSARLAHASAPLRLLVGAAIVVAVFSLAARTMLRNAVWADPIALWREAAEAAPGNALPRTVMGEALHEAGRHEEAIGAFGAALALDPADELKYMKLAVCLSELGRFDEARETFETLRRLEPHSPIVSTGLGAVAMMAGDPERARHYFQDTLDEDPHNIMALQWLAVLEEEGAKPAEALRRCEQVQQLMPGSVSAKDCIDRNRSRLPVR